MAAAYGCCSSAEIWEINVATGEWGGLNQDIKEERPAAV